MPEMTEPYYVSMLKGHGFTPDPDDHQYGALGLCWKISQEIGEGSYWTYGQKDLYDIKIHNFFFHKDSLLEFSLPECLSITRYDSISGEELSPYRRLSAGCIKTYIGGYEPYQVLIHKNIPIRSIGIEIMPAYYEDYLKKQYPEEYRNPVEAFRKIDQTTDFPEMSRLLSEVQNYRGDGIAAKLFYESKVAESPVPGGGVPEKTSSGPHQTVSGGSGAHPDRGRLSERPLCRGDPHGAADADCLHGNHETQEQFQKGLRLHHHRVHPTAPHEPGGVPADQHRLIHRPDRSDRWLLHLQLLCGAVPEEHRAAAGRVSESWKPVLKHQKELETAAHQGAGSLQFPSFFSIFLS